MIINTIGKYPKGTEGTAGYKYKHNLYNRAGITVRDSDLLERYRTHDKRVESEDVESGRKEIIKVYRDNFPLDK
jgi:hypothetical protein